MIHIGSIVRQLREANTVKNGIDRKISVSRFIYRPISFYLAVPFVLLGFSANGVTLLRFIIAFGGFFLLAKGRYVPMVAGSAVLFFSALLDYVDGNIARFRKQPSHFGKFLEDTTDTIVKALIPLAASIGLYLRPDPILSSSPYHIPGILILMMGATAALAISFQGMIAYRFHAALLEAKEPNAAPARSSAEHPKPPRPGAPSPSQYLANSIVFLLRREAYFMLGGIVLFAIFDIMSVFLLIRWIASLTHLAFESLHTLKHAQKALAIYRPL